MLSQFNVFSSECLCLLRFVLFRPATVALGCALLDAIHPAALLKVASVSHNGYKRNTEKAFPKNIAELHAVELLRPGARKQALNTGSQSLLPTPWRDDGSQFVREKE